MPYRIDLYGAGADALDRLVELGALDVERLGSGLAALMPDAVAPADVASAIGVHTFSVSPAASRDDGSVWILDPRPIQVGRLRILPAGSGPEPDAIRLIDGPVFGSGLHPTTALCLEALQDVVETGPIDAVLDVGTGSGILSLAALALGVARAVAIDVDGEALRAAAENARLNDFEAALELRPGGPEALSGTWPLVLANILEAPLIEMAPTLVRRVAPRGTVVLSGIRTSLEADVGRAYRDLGLRRVRTMTRAGWVALVLHTSW